MGSESIAHEAGGQMGYWFRGHDQLRWWYMYERERKDHVKYLDDHISWKYFVRIVKLWNDMCNEAFPGGFTSLSCFKSFLKNL